MKTVYIKYQIVGLTPEGSTEVSWIVSSCHGWKVGEHGAVFVSDRTLEVGVPDDTELVPLQVAALQAERVRALEQYTQQIASIDERLGKLQSLEMS
jgi:hypothetical protein